MPKNSKALGKTETMKTTFIIRQIVEKSIVYSRQVCPCYVDLKNVFDRERRTDILNLLQDPDIQPNITETLKYVKENNTTKDITSEGIIEPIMIKSGIRQGDSLSPLNNNVKKKKGYRMGLYKITIFCYDLQRQLHMYNIVAKRFLMIISPEKTKCMVISKEPKRCKLGLDNKIIEQIMTFNYLGV